MTPRRRRASAEAPPWWHARGGFIVALLGAPAIWIYLVSGVVNLVDRLGNLEHDVQALQRDVARLDADRRRH